MTQQVTRRMLDSEGRDLLSTNGGAAAIEFEHFQIHRGKMFFACDEQALAAASSTSRYLIIPPTTSTTECHFRWDVTVLEGRFKTAIYEDSTLAAGGTGTALSIYNRKRTSSTTALTNIFLVSTFAGASSLGAMLDCHRAGVGGAPVSRSGGDVGAVNEWMLDSSKKYIATVEAIDPSLTAQFDAGWYEVPPVS